jgi:hypothetical protein
MSAVQQIVKGGKVVATIIGKMVVKGNGGKGADGYLGMIKKSR